MEYSTDRHRPAVDEVLSLARRYVSVEAVTTFFMDGMRHYAYELDHRYVLKTARGRTNPIELQREAEVLPFLEKAGVPAARFVAYDAGTTPFLISTSVPGMQLRRLPGSLPESLIDSIAEGLAVLHEADLSGLQAPSVQTLDVPREYQAGVEYHRDELGVISGRQASDLMRIFEERWPPIAHSPLGLTHSDLWPHHCIVDTQTWRLSGFIDFADAMLAPAAWDFARPWGVFFGSGSEAFSKLRRVYAKRRRLGPNFEEECDFYALLWALRHPQWARDMGLGGMGAYFSLAVIERALATWT